LWPARRTGSRRSSHVVHDTAPIPEEKFILHGASLFCSERGQRKIMERMREEKVGGSWLLFEHLPVPKPPQCLSTRTKTAYSLFRDSLVLVNWRDAGGIFACPDTDSFSARCQNREGQSPLATHTAAFVHVLFCLLRVLLFALGRVLT
jgi:hypothetical protein